MAHIAIVGAGIAGVTTAYSLLSRGHAVTVLERHPFPAMETSYANGGQLSACNAEVWNNLSTMIKGLKWIFKRDAPLSLNMKPGFHKYAWLFDFVTASSDYRENTIRTVRLALDARKHMRAILDKEKIKFDFVNRGILHFFHDRGSFEKAEKVNALLVQGGLDRRAVTPVEMKTIEPTLQGDFYGGFFTESDSTGDIHKFTRELAKVCERLGAQFRYGSHVTSIESCRPGKVVIDYTRGASDEFASRSTTERIEVEALVICAGVGSREIASSLGDHVNIYPVKGYSITVNLNDQCSRDRAPWVSLLDEEAKIVSSRLGENRFRVAGTAEINGHNLDIRSDRIKPLLLWVRRLFPTVSTEEVVPWCGLRPMMPNMMPRVGPGRRSGIFYNTGHGHLGWTLCTATSELVADAIDLALNVPTLPLDLVGAELERPQPN